MQLDFVIHDGVQLMKAMLGRETISKDVKDLHPAIVARLSIRVEERVNKIPGIYRDA